MAIETTDIKQKALSLVIQIERSFGKNHAPRRCHPHEGGNDFQGTHLGSCSGWRLTQGASD